MGEGNSSMSVASGVIWDIVKLPGAEVPLLRTTEVTMKLSLTAAFLAAVLALAPTAPAHADPAPAVGDACSDTNKIVPDGTGGELVCSIVATSPATMTRWKPVAADLETVLMGSSCGTAGSWGDFRTARSTDNYLVWCMGRGPNSNNLPSWVLATP